MEERMKIHAALVATWGLVACNMINNPPMTAFPAPVTGEVDASLPEIKTAFEADFLPKSKVLRIESAERTWDIRRSSAGIAVSRTALVHVGFQVGDKCYYQPRIVYQEAAGAEGWGAVKLGDWVRAYSKEQSLGGNAAFKAEPLPFAPDSSDKSDANPIDCAAIAKTGNEFRHCEGQTANLCEVH
jgi:hypothetical protein